MVVCSTEAAISQGHDGIVVFPVFDGTAGIIDDAVATGIPVITIIAEVQAPSKRMTHVGRNNCAAGGEPGKLVAEKLGGSGKLGVITGYFGAGQHEERMGGTVDYLKDNHPDMEIIGPFENKDTLRALSSASCPWPAPSCDQFVTPNSGFSPYS